MSYRNHRSNRDVRQITQRQYIGLIDPATMGREDFEEEELEVEQHQRRRGFNRGRQPGGSDRFRQPGGGDRFRQPGGAGSRQPHPAGGDRGLGNVRQVIITDPDRTAFSNLVVIRSVSNLGLKPVLSILRDNVELFRPIAPQISETDVQFYVNQKGEADTYRSLSRRIVEPNSGTRLVINVRRVNAPWMTLPKNQCDTIIKVLEKRYNVTTRTLDLGDFGGDKEFSSKKMRCSLSRNEVLVFIADVVKSRYAEAECLSLKENRLSLLSYVATLCFRIPEITKLDLSNNNLNNIEELEKLTFWKIRCLNLENNPLVAKYEDPSKYIRDVHAAFPLVNLLDGVSVAPSAVQDVELSQIMPTPRPSFLPNANAQQMIENFLVEFLRIYDDASVEERRKLLDAYFATAEFTYAIRAIDNTGKGNNERFFEYLRMSRNVFLDDSWKSRPKRVRYKGSMEIAIQLAKLPSTCHLVHTFLLDISYIDGNVCGFTLRGLVRDGDDRDDEKALTKLFTRHFLVVVNPEGKIAILCDTLTIIAMTASQSKAYEAMVKKTFENPATTVNVDNGPPMIVVTAPPSTPNTADPLIRQQMIQQFALQTGLRQDVAQQALDDNNYDYEAAGRRFNEIRNTIPPEAFTTQ